VEDDGGTAAPPSDAASGRPGPPLLSGRTAGPQGAPLVYLCRNMVCGLPAGTLEDLRKQLESMGG
jgi:uncharacterized protein YyaL (SSP411 family)